MRHFIAAACIAFSFACGESQGPANPLPVLLSVEPDTIHGEASSGILELEGDGFGSGTAARVDGLDRATVVVDGNHAQLTLFERDLATGGTLSITVSNSAPGGGVSGSYPVYVGFPTPSIASVSPTRIGAGSDSTMVEILGSGFRTQGSVEALLGDEPLQTTVEGPDRLQVLIPAEMLQDANTHELQVRNAPPGDGLSDPAVFEVIPPAPVLASVSPDTLLVDGGVQLGLRGSHFAVSTTLVVEGRIPPLAARWVGVDSLLTVILPASVFSSVGPISIAAFTPGPDGGVSDPITVQVVDAPPQVTGVIPPALTAGPGGSRLIVRGKRFDPGSAATWDGIPRPSEFVDATTMYVDLTAGDASAPGTGVLRVTRPSTGPSQPAFVPVLPAASPTLDSQILDLWTNDLVADPTRDVLYATVQGFHPQYGNHLVAIDPMTATVLWSVPVGSEPGWVVVTDDGSFAYVALRGASLIVRVDLEAQAKVLDIPLPTGRAGRRLYGGDLVPIPGSPTSLAVALTNSCCSPRHEGVAIFDDAVARPQAQLRGNRLEPAERSDRLYSLNTETTDFSLYRLSIDPDGVSTDSVFSRIVWDPGAEMIYDTGLLFTNAGYVFDAVLMRLVGTVNVSGVVRPDVLNGRVHYYQDEWLHSKHYATYSELGALHVPDAWDSRVMVRFGGDGLAFGGPRNVVFVRSSLIGPSS